MIDTEVLASINAGNGSTTIGYAIPFPFLDPAHVIVDVLLSGAAAPTRLGMGEYTVVTSGVGAPYVTTATAYPATATVTISRWVPLTQPLNLPGVGAFSPDALERGLDRIVQQIQQIWRQVSGAGEVTGPGDSLGIQDVFVFADAAARAVTKPRRVGQLGVQVSDYSIWIAQSTATGDWRDSARRVSAAQPERLVFALCSDQGTPGATQTAIVTRAAEWAADAILTGGDNHYSPATFAQSWAAFSAWISAQKVFPALGNHDVADWAAHYALFPYLTGTKRYYQKIFGNGLVDVFVLHSGRNSSWSVVEPDGNAVGSVQHSWFVSALNASTARWKLVVMHHPPVTASSEANRADTNLDWPEFARVDGIVCGHVHFSEWLTCRGTPVVNVSGAVEQDGTVSPLLNLTGTDAAGSDLLWIDDRRRLMSRIIATQTRLVVSYHETASGKLVYQRDLSDRTESRGVWGQELVAPGTAVSAWTLMQAGRCPVDLRSPVAVVQADVSGAGAIGFDVNVDGVTVAVGILSAAAPVATLALSRNLRRGAMVQVSTGILDGYTNVSGMRIDISGSFCS